MIYRFIRRNSKTARPEEIARVDSQTGVYSGPMAKEMEMVVGNLAPPLKTWASLPERISGSRLWVANS